MSSQTINDPPANAQWGGRFAAAPDEVMQRINTSIGFDRQLWRQDIAGSRAHAAMLAQVGIISPADQMAIDDGLSGTPRAAATTRWQPISGFGCATPSTPSMPRSAI